MKLILKEKNRYLIRFDQGEELIANLNRFCQKAKIRAGLINGLGSSQELILSHYDLEKKKYSDLRIRQKMEINSLTGIIATQKKEIIIHLHGLFSDKSMNVRGGHVKKLIIAATAEIILEKLNGKILREYSKRIGLNLLK